MRRPRKGSASPSTEAAAATQMQVQGAFAPGGAQSQAVVESDEPAVPGHARPARPRRSPDDARVLAKPPVRKLAKDLGVDLATVTATGPNGSITRDDVTAAAGSAGTSSETAAPATTRLTLRRTRAPRADQGRPQDDGPGDGRLGLLRART